MGGWGGGWAGWAARRGRVRQSARRAAAPRAALLTPSLPSAGHGVGHGLGRWTPDGRPEAEIGARARILTPFLFFPQKKKKNRETYQYYDLPLCQPASLKHKPQGLGEVGKEREGGDGRPRRGPGATAHTPAVQARHRAPTRAPTHAPRPAPPPQVVDGNRQIASPYAIAFKVDAPTAKLCTRSLTPADVGRLRAAVLANWYAQFRLDGLPVYTFLGRADAPDARPGAAPVARLYTHYHWDLKFNGQRVVEASVRTDPEQRWEKGWDGLG